MRHCVSVPTTVILALIFEPFDANSGTNPLDGPTLTTTPTVALIPNFVGEGYTYAVRREGTNGLLLSWTGEEFQGNYRLRRLR